MQCVIRLEQPEGPEGDRRRTEAKLDLISIISDLMPGGKPSFLQMVQYPTIQQLVAQHGKKNIRFVLYLMVKDLCSSLNIAHNMNEDQVIEAAAMLLDECDNFRLEDYQMMFALAKRGQLVEFKHQLDISVIGKMLDEYYTRRQAAAQQHQEEQKRKEKQAFEDMKVQQIEGPEGLFTFADVLKNFTQWQKENTAEENRQVTESYKRAIKWAKEAVAEPEIIEAVLSDPNIKRLPKTEQQKQRDNENY